MKEKEKFSLSKRLRSFRFAFNGLKLLAIYEHNSRIHLVAAVLVTGLGIYFGVTSLEWALLALAVGLVFLAELFNTAIEQLVNHVSEERSARAGAIKDLAAAAVLVATLTAVGIGVGVFYKYM